MMAAAQDEIENFRIAFHHGSWYNHFNKIVWQKATAIFFRQKVKRLK